MKPFDLNKASTILGMVIIAITSVITFNNLFNTVRDHEARLIKIESTEQQLIQLQKSVDYATWRIDGLSKDFDKLSPTKAKR